MNNNQNLDLNYNPYINNNQNNNMQNGATNMNSGMNTTSNMPNMQQAPQTNNNNLFSNINSSNLIKGALIGAAATYLLTNENLQKTLFKTFAKLGDVAGAGIEELKERYEDAKAELEAQEHENF